ncbi:MAG TPA: hypothetical protein VF530_09660 [Planctomycetota bacterium]
MSERREVFEPWAFAAFAVAAATAGLFLYLGLRPGGAGPVLAYRLGLLFLGWVAAVGMLLALLWSLRRRPVLQRRRAWPLMALGASLWLCSLPIAYPSSHEGRYSTTRFRLPFEGEARVRFGGDDARDNPLVFDPGRCFGFGFEASGGGALSVVAPAEGELVARAPGRAGQILVLATGPGEWCLLEGLEATTLRVQPGQRVAAGEPLGEARGVLYLHLQDAPEPGRGEGIPLRIHDYRVHGRPAEAGRPVPPQVVASAGPPDPGR